VECERPKTVIVHFDVGARTVTMLNRSAEISAVKPMIESGVPTAQQILQLSTRELGLLLLPRFEQPPPMPVEYLMRRLAVDQLRRPELMLPLSEAVDYLFREGLLVHAFHSGYSGHRALVPSSKAKDLLKGIAVPSIFSDTSARELVQVRLTDSLREMERGREHYADAVFKAFREVEIAVREKSGVLGKVGVELVREAFAWPNGPLTDSSMQEPEAKALGHLFAGAMGYLKNPPSHRHIEETDPARTLRLLLFASELLNIVETRRGYTEDPS